ncbi:MAG: HAMP domain-containing histidine kinase [Candidatus Omnitrophica bacterium]|nr:HAMP domain-containing histidine kinase [Candidatus Omnitrophota bacterium]
MKKNKTRKRKPREDQNSYKVVISDLGMSPFRIMRASFVLMGILPLLIIFYIIVGRKFLFDIFLGTNGLIAFFAVMISLIGFVYAYTLIANMIRKLVVYSAERKQIDEEKTELLLAVSHDLKTPLTILKTGMRNLTDGIGGALSKVHVGVADHCLRAVDRINRFIDELLDFSKVGFMRTNIKRDLIDLGEMVKNEVDAMSDLARENGQDLRVKIEAKDAKVWADEKKMSRAVMNLLSNAIKYTPKGGKINATVSTDENTTRFTLINTGPGIQPNELDKIFKKYERLDRHSDVEGTGLGLSIVKEIMDLHKGRLTVKSEPGKETEFDLILPRDLRERV